MALRSPEGTHFKIIPARPVHKLFGKGVHSVNEYDWKQFLAFADRHLRIEKPPKPARILKENKK